MQCHMIRYSNVSGWIEINPAVECACKYTWTFNFNVSAKIRYTRNSNSQICLLPEEFFHIFFLFLLVVELYFIRAGSDLLFDIPLYQISCFIIGIKPVFLCINICWTPRVVLKPEPKRLGIQ